jgi:hypothetical protein
VVVALLLAFPLTLVALRLFALLFQTLQFFLHKKYDK